jgi:hypothetical protein
LFSLPLLQASLLSLLCVKSLAQYRYQHS